MVVAVKVEIVQAMKELGVRYRVPDGEVPHWPHEGPGIVLQAEEPRDLRAALSMTHVSLTKFRRALGSLMYHHHLIARCHIDKVRYYKLLLV